MHIYKKTNDMTEGKENQTEQIIYPHLTYVFKSVTKWIFVFVIMNA